MTMRQLPDYDDLPSFRGIPGCAWDVWGKGDELGTVNLLTNTVVQQAAREEIRTGKRVAVDLPVNFFTQPLFGRRPAEITSWVKPSDRRDEEIRINTQSSSHWTGLLHFPLPGHGVLYQGVSCSTAPVGTLNINEPGNVDPNTICLGIHGWAQHGISGRGVLLDVARHYSMAGNTPPYDPFRRYEISSATLEACARDQGVVFRPGDILLLRTGFLESDVSPLTFQMIVPMWGMPIGKLFNLDVLSEHCAEASRYTFFFSSWPINVLGGVASPPNAMAIF
ncbi:hypothetical protein K488DRAFT_85615 [Vararia minispora EC-137]|uniref:Uncharacterized protein n=1 Tax=Vararia minispora EC-137 TaxID=1314806 RepID=A0ACB8QLK2_9AGAM|nr:hypothetical protein K488DRAFT_85615 [Vararia minispora EC-137]